MVRFIVILSAVFGMIYGLKAADQSPSKKETKRHVEKAGGFSYVPPPGTKLIDRKGLKFKVGLLPILPNGWQPELSFQEYSYKGPITFWVDSKKKHLAKTYKEYKLLKEKKLKTAAEQEGVFMLFQRNQGNKSLRFCYFFIDLDGNKKILAMSASPSDGGEKMDAIFEACYQTLRLEKP